MDNNTRELFDAIMGLSHEEKFRILKALIANLKEHEGPDVSTDLISSLEYRCAKIGQRYNYSEKMG